MIKLDNTIQEIENYLGKNKFNHITKIYNYIRSSNSISDVFRLDYLQTNEVDKYFIVEFLQNEPNYDFSEEFSEILCDDIIGNINDGYGYFVFL
jgi:tyrosine-protein phosphatase YwqE